MDSHLLLTDNIVQVKIDDVDFLLIFELKLKALAVQEGTEVHDLVLDNLGSMLA